MFPDKRKSHYICLSVIFNDSVDEILTHFTMGVWDENYNRELHFYYHGFVLAKDGNKRYGREIDNPEQSEDKQWTCVIKISQWIVFKKEPKKLTK